MLTEITFQLVLQIFLPAFFIYKLANGPFSKKSDWLLNSTLFGLILLFVVTTARWDSTSYYLRILIPPFYILAVYLGYGRISVEKTNQNSGKRWFKYLFYGVAIIPLIAINLDSLSGYFKPDKSGMNLSYPLRGGVYYVGGGGTSRWINNHNHFPPQDYALDIVRLNKFGNRALGLWPKDLNLYAIYGDSVYSPCAGRIIAMVKDLPDQIPPARDGANPAGNFALLLCNDAEVLLAHLMQNSVTVSEGAVVNQGDVIGKVGNSGNSSQPHLHMHVELGGEPGQILNGEGVPSTFNNRFLVRNSLFTGN